MSGGELFDAGTIRALGRRTVVVRRAVSPTLVLGSRQPDSIVERDALVADGVALLRRRSGGGAVLVEPGRAVWLDTWVPSTDPLFSDDVGLSRQWIGSWWARALDVDGLAVHDGPSSSSRWSALICFAGVARGEVVHRGRKVVGVAQWRSREGALTHSFAHLRTAWPRLVRLFADPEVEVAADELATSTAALGDLVGADEEQLVADLLGALPEPASWDVRAD
ncbi:MAG: lipoyl protein ligase domain-containing protein [Acidimicrobiales bacterium]